MAANSITTAQIQAGSQQYKMEEDMGIELLEVLPLVLWIKNVQILQITF